MKRDLIIGMVVAALLHGALLAPVMPWNKRKKEVIQTTEVALVAEPQTKNEEPPPKPEEDENAENVPDGPILPPDLINAGLAEVIPSSVALGSLVMHVKPEPPRPPRQKGMETIGIPTGWQRSAGDTKTAESMTFFDKSELDNDPSPRYTVKPEYPFALKRALIQGTVRILANVDTEGKVVSAKVESTTNNEFDKPSLDAILRWKFYPGLRNGKKVPFRVRIPFEFTITE